MPQYLIANYLPDDFDPSGVTEAMIEEIHALNREMIAAGARKFACGISPASNAKTVRKQPDGTVLRPATQRRCGSSLMVRCSSPMGHTPRPRSIWAVSGYWKLPIWTRRWRGRARVPSHAMRQARCASFFSTRLRRKQRNSLATATRRHGDTGTRRLRPIRGGMFIESAASKKFVLAPAERNIVWLPMTETLRSAGARVIEVEAVSINISLPWSEN